MLSVALSVFTAFACSSNDKDDSPAAATTIDATYNFTDDDSKKLCVQYTKVNGTNNASASCDYLDND